ncbi:MAG: hypothetical protein NTW96_06465 [Planctomycetia bacterium]|nr:hypothetical protein [Planctomycetia bacterium]
MVVNKEPLRPADSGDFDGPPEQEMATLFAASGPPARPVDAAKLLSTAGVLPASRVPISPWSSPMFRRIAALVSLAAGVAVVVTLLLLFGSSATVSFAEVIEQIAKTRSMAYKQTTTIPGMPAQTFRIAALADGLIRVDFPDGNYTVMDTKTGKALCVSPNEKKATLMIGLPVSPGLNVYEIIRNAVNEKSARLPDEMIDGRKAHVFRVEPPEAVRTQGPFPAPPMEVWVDPETKLPIRMEPIGKEGEGQVVMDDFVFDKPLDPSLFSLDPPEGYAVRTEGLASLLPAPKEPDLLAPQVMPGVGLGPVKFGMSKEEVVKILGKPDLDEKEGVAYPSRGYEFIISPRRGVVAITCFSQQTHAFKVRDFAGKTKEGIGIGSSREDLEKAFGKPNSVENYGPEAAHAAHIIYSKLGLEFTLYSGKVVGFMMSAAP